MKRLTATLLCVLVVAGQALAAISLQDRFSSNAAELKGVMPATNTAIATRTFYVAAIVVINNAATSKTLNIRDRSTSCASGPCNLVPTDLSIAGGQMYPIDLPWVVATSGIQLSASDGTSLQYRIIGSY